MRWEIDAPSGSINGCNNRLIIPALGMEYTFHTGKNVITFTTEHSGTLPYTCWMGMIRGVNSGRPFRKHRSKLKQCLPLKVS